MSSVTDDAYGTQMCYYSILSEGLVGATWTLLKRRQS
jgi:hypothetical protein